MIYLFIALWLCFGLGFWNGLVLLRRDTFNGASTKSILLGFLLGVFAWPIGIYVICGDNNV
jgi:hypothetical protein